LVPFLEELRNGSTLGSAYGRPIQLTTFAHPASLGNHRGDPVRAGIDDQNIGDRDEL
jgi:hypothetical protein